MSAEATSEGGGWAARGRRLRERLDHDPLDPMAGAPDRELRSAATLALALTLIILLVGAPPETHTLTPLAAVAGLAVPGLARNRWYWVAVAGLFLLSPVARPWLELDNHSWLEMYWFLAVAASRFALRPDEVLRLSARLLVGLAFAFAVLWKVLSGEFLSGAFFDQGFALDPRLAEVAIALGLFDAAALEANRAILGGWLVPGETPMPGELEMSAALLVITPLAAWVTIVVEAAVAATFLAPLAPRLRWLRDVSLLVFLALTYPVAPVTPFGRLVVAMAAVVSELPSRRRAVVYVGAFIGVTLLRERDVVLRWLEHLLGTGA